MAAVPEGLRPGTLALRHGSKAVDDGDSAPSGAAELHLEAVVGVSLRVEAPLPQRPVVVGIVGLGAAEGQGCPCADTAADR